MNQPLCPWCRQRPAGKILPNGLTSDGICALCVERLIAEWEHPSARHPPGLPEPIEDSLGPFRGVVVGIVIALLLWAAAVVVWRYGL